MRVNGGIEKDQWVLKRANGGIGQGLWGQGCKLYLARLQALPYRVGSSTLQGCNLYLAGLQALPYRVASSTLQGCKLYLTGL